MLKFYLAGPMRGLRHYGFNTFESGADYLRWLGHDVVSPHQIDLDEKFVSASWSWTSVPTHHDRKIRLFQEVEPTKRFTFEKAMRRDLKALCDCDGIALLPGWEDSVGARYEFAVNNMVGGLIRFVDPWVCFTETAPFEHGRRSGRTWIPGADDDEWRRRHGLIKEMAADAQELGAYD